MNVVDEVRAALANYMEPHSDMTHDALTAELVRSIGALITAYQATEVEADDGLCRRRYPGASHTHSCVLLRGHEPADHRCQCGQRWARD